MTNEAIGRRSRWMMRAMEWDDPRARYPNIWFHGMPRNILAFERVVSRLRIGDLVAVYYPASQRHSERAERFLGLSRVVGLRMADQAGFGWIDFEIAHKFEPPLKLEQQPRRGFLCCDPGWPGPELELFRELFAAAVAAGWEPHEDELEATEGEAAAEGLAPPPPGLAAPAEEPEVPAGEATEEAAAVQPLIAEAKADEPELPEGPLRQFAGVGYSGDMRDPRDRTWLAIVDLRGDRLRVARLEATGRQGLQGDLRGTGRILKDVEAIGLDFPFGLPTPFAEKLLEGAFPEEGWWALVRKLEKMTRPEYLVALQEFRDAAGEVKRLADEQANAASPLRRVDPDLGTRTFHGIRMIAGDRSRFAVRPFENAQGKLLLEVFPNGTLRKLGLESAEGGGRLDNRAAVRALGTLGSLPLDLDQKQSRACEASRDALDAVISARCAAAAVLTGEVDKGPEALAEGEGDRVRREGWIYGLDRSD